MYFWLRRICETLFCIFVASLPVFGLVQMKSIPENVGAYIIIFSISSIIYLVLTVMLLKAHLMAVYETKIYLTVNLTLWFAICVLATLGIYANIKNYINSSTYTAVFGFTKCIRPWTESLVGHLNLTDAKTKFISSMMSMSLVMLIHLAFIFWFVFDRHMWRKDMVLHGQERITKSPEELIAEEREMIELAQQTRFEHFDDTTTNEDDDE